MYKTHAQPFEGNKNSPRALNLNLNLKLSQVK